MPSPLSNTWTLRKLIQNTYGHAYSKNRFDYKIRDLVKVVRVNKVAVYDGKNPGQARTKYEITTQSTPQYAPYYSLKDRWGRTRKRQFKYRHEYTVIIQLDELSLDVPFKGRVGALGKWDFSDNGKAKRVNGVIQEGTNVQKGLNGDFFFRCSWVWRENGILYGRDYTTRPPAKTNPNGVVYAPKHFLAVVQFLMERGILK